MQLEDPARFLTGLEAADVVAAGEGGRVRHSQPSLHDRSLVRFRRDAVGALCRRHCRRNARQNAAEAGEIAPPNSWATPTPAMLTRR